MVAGDVVFKPPDSHLVASVRRSHAATDTHRKKHGAARTPARIPRAALLETAPAWEVHEVPEPGLRDRQHEDGPRAARVVHVPRCRS